MCVGCADWVTYCDVPGCTGGSPGVNGSRPSTLRHFYLGDPLCLHLRERTGAEVAAFPEDDD